MVALALIARRRRYALPAHFDPAFPVRPATTTAVPGRPAPRVRLLLGWHRGPGGRPVCSWQEHAARPTAAGG